MITTTLETATLVTTLDTSDSLATGIDNATYSAIVTGGDTIVTEAMGAPGARGEKGEKGDKGDASTVPGPKGETGAGVPSGGATGQYLRKSGNADYAFAWGTLDVGTAAAADTGVSGHRLGFLDASNFYSANQYYSGGRTFLHNDAGSTIESYGSQLVGLKPLTLNASQVVIDTGLYARSFVTVAGDVSPVSPNTNALGDPTYRWRSVYAVGANISGTAQLGEVTVQPSSGNGRLTIKPALGGAVYSILDLKGADNTTALEIDAGAAGSGLYSNSYRFSSADGTKLYATLDSSGLATGKLTADTITSGGRMLANNGFTAYGDISLGGYVTAQGLNTTFNLIAGNGFTAYGDIRLSGPVSTFADATIGGNLSVTGSHISAPSYTPLFIQRFGGDVTISGYGTGVTRINGQSLNVYGSAQIATGDDGRPAARFAKDYSGVTGPFHVGDGATGLPGPLNFTVTNAGAMTATSATINGASVTVNNAGKAVLRADENGGSIGFLHANGEYLGQYNLQGSGMYLDAIGPQVLRNAAGTQRASFSNDGGAIAGNLNVYGTNPTITLTGDSNSYYPTLEFRAGAYGSTNSSTIVGYDGMRYNASQHRLMSGGKTSLFTGAGGTQIHRNLSVYPAEGEIGDIGIDYNSSNYYIFTQWNVGFNSHNYQSVYSTQVGGFGTIYRGAGHLFRSGDDNNKLAVDTNGVEVTGGLKLTPGAPASPTNGTIWTTAEGLFARINGVTMKVTATAV